MQNYKIGNAVHVLDSVEFEHLLPDGAIKITQAAANALSAPIPETPAEADARKDNQINAEFTSALLAIVKIMDATNADTIIAAAKALRKNEL